MKIFILSGEFILSMKRLLCLLLLVIFCGNAFAQRDTIPVYFATGKSILTPGIQDGLTRYIYQKVLHAGQQLQIVGYTDYVGTNQSNDALSKARAATVKRFLVTGGFAAKDITICIGKGEIDRPGMDGEDGSPRDRRVDIVINRKPVTPPIEKPVVVKETPKQTRQPAAKKEMEKAPVATLPDLASIRENETIQLKQLYFYPGRHVIRPESLGELTKLEKILEKNPTLKIGIEGHICCTDPNQGDALDYDTRDLSLSLNRAKEVYTFLVRKGIEEERLSYKGFGATRKLVEEHNEDDANMNRRVEIRVLAK